MTVEIVSELHAAVHTATVYEKSSHIPQRSYHCGIIQSIQRSMSHSQNIARLRKAKGLRQKDLAEMLDVEQPTVQRWEAGDRDPSLDMLAEIADALGVSVEDIVTNGIQAIGPRLNLKGVVSAGLWQEAFEWPEEEWMFYTGRADVDADIGHRFGLRVEGDSMNELYPPGTILDCVSLFGRAEALPGKRVVILRTNSDHKVEATVKELVDIDGVLWARPRSFNPAHQAFRLDEPAVGITQTRIIAVVVAAIIPEG